MLRTVLIGHDCFADIDAWQVGDRFSGVLLWSDTPRLEPLVVGGCLVLDCFPALREDGALTESVIRTIRVVSQLHERGTGRWLPMPGRIRAEPVPDTTWEHLRHDPPNPGVSAEWPTGPLRIVSEEEYLRIAGHLLPAEQWQPRGFLLEID